MSGKVTFWRDANYFHNQNSIAISFPEWNENSNKTKYTCSGNGIAEASKSISKCWIQLQASNSQLV